MRIALYEPEIAGNVGAVMRLGACLGAAVDLIEPLGFAWDDKRVRRAAMDYIDHVAVARHPGFDAFRTAIGSRRLVLFTTKSRESVYDFDFMADDVLLFGKESAGVPAAGARADWLRAGTDVNRLAHTYYRTGDLLAGSNMRLKLANIADRLLLRPRPTMLLIVSAEQTGAQDAAAALAAFHQSTGDPGEWMDRIARLR